MAQPSKKKVALKKATTKKPATTGRKRGRPSNAEKRAGETTPEYGKVETLITPQLINKLTTEGVKLPDGSMLYATKLQARHSEFLQRAAKGEGRNNGQMLERFVRIEYARDPSKGGAISYESEDGNSFSGPAADMKV